MFVNRPLTAQQKAQRRALAKRESRRKAEENKKIAKLSKKLEKLERRRKKREEDAVKAVQEKTRLRDETLLKQDRLTEFDTARPIFPTEILERIISHLLPFPTHSFPIGPTQHQPHSTINNLFRLFRVSRSFSELVRPAFYAHLRVTGEKQWNWLWRKGGGLVDERGGPRQVTGLIRKITIAEEHRPHNWRTFGPVKNALALGLALTDEEKIANARTTASATVNGHGSTADRTEEWTKSTQAAVLIGSRINKTLSIHLLECKTGFRSKLLMHGLSNLLPEKLHVEGLVGPPVSTFASLTRGIDTTRLTQLSISKIDLSTEFYAHLLPFLRTIKTLPQKTFRLILAYDADTCKFSRRTMTVDSASGKPNINGSNPIWKPIPFLCFVENLHKDAYLAQIRCVWVRRVIGKFLPPGQYFDSAGVTALVHATTDDFDAERTKHTHPPHHMFGGIGDLLMGAIGPLDVDQQITFAQAAGLRPPQPLADAVRSFLEYCSTEHWSDEEVRVPFVKWASAKVYSYPKSFKGQID